MGKDGPCQCLPRVKTVSGAMHKRGVTWDDVIDFPLALWLGASPYVYSLLRLPPTNADRRTHLDSIPAVYKKS